MHASTDRISHMGSTPAGPIVSFNVKLFVIRQLRLCVN